MARSGGAHTRPQVTRRAGEALKLAHAFTEVDFLNSYVRRVTSQVNGFPSELTDDHRQKPF